MTKAGSLAVGMQRDDVADLDRAVGDDHPIDQQLHRLALLGEVGTGQAGPNPLAEIRGRGRPAGELGPPIRLCFQLAGLRHQCRQPLLQRLPPTPVFRQRDDGEQVRFSRNRCVAPTFLGG